jgi:hypothetical protein
MSRKGREKVQSKTSRGRFDGEIESLVPLCDTEDGFGYGKGSFYSFASVSEDV